MAMRDDGYEVTRDEGTGNEKGLQKDRIHVNSYNDP